MEVPSSIAGADITGRCVQVKPWDENHVRVASISVNEVGSTMRGLIGSTLAGSEEHSSAQRCQSAVRTTADGCRRRCVSAIR